MTVSGGKWPVHGVVLDLIGDGQSAWYYLVEDARGQRRMNLLVTAVPGTYQLTVSVQDERGCTATLPGPLPVVTVLP